MVEKILTSPPFHSSNLPIFHPSNLPIFLTSLADIISYRLKCENANMLAK